MIRKLVGLFGVIDASGELLLNVLDKKINCRNGLLASSEEMYQILNDFRHGSSKGFRKLPRYFRPVDERQL